MPTWHELLSEISTTGSGHDVVRRKYLTKLHRLTGRNVILYYSGWLQKPDVKVAQQLTDSDKTGFMTSIHKLDTSKGLDLILHTPGGETAATESLVDYLRAKFDTNIRAIVPQLAMSAGTMIACACREIVMGKHSSLGPIDPILNGLPAHGVVEEFKRAYDEMKADQHKAFVWQPILAKYHPTLVGECEKAITWSRSMTRDWLLTGMLQGQQGAEQRADTILNELVDHSVTLSHARHLSAKKCRELGLTIVALEDDQKLQEAVLTLHHACIHTLSSTGAYKMIENHEGVAYMQMFQQVIVKGNP